MKIVLLNTDDSMGGAAIACLRLRDALKKNTDWEITVLVQEQKKPNSPVIFLNKTWLSKKIAFFRFAWERLYFRFFEKNKTIRFAFSPANTGIDISNHPLIQEADIIHLHWINFGFLSLDSLEKLFMLNKKIVWTMHDMWLFTGGCHHSGDCNHFQNQCGYCETYLKKPGKSDLSFKVLRKKQSIFEEINPKKIAFIACSEWLEKRAKNSSLLNKYSLKSIPNPIDTELFKPKNKSESRQKLHLPTDKKLILFVAAKISVIWKGFSFFQEALHILHAQLVDKEAIELIILGESDEESLRALPFKTHSLGKIFDTETIIDVYNAGDIFVIPSIQENLPNTIMESMACGTPAVGFEVGGIPEMIEHQSTGYLAKYKSIEDLAKGMHWVLFEANYQMLASRSREKVLANYSEEAVAQQYKIVYENLQ